MTEFVCLLSCFIDIIFGFHEGGESLLIHLCCLFHLIFDFSDSDGWIFGD